MSQNKIDIEDEEDNENDRYHFEGGSDDEGAPISALRSGQSPMVKKPVNLETFPER